MPCALIPRIAEYALIERFCIDLVRWTSAVVSSSCTLRRHESMAGNECADLPRGSDRTVTPACPERRAARAGLVFPAPPAQMQDTPNDRCSPSVTCA